MAFEVNNTNFISRVRVQKKSVCMKQNRVARGLRMTSHAFYYNYSVIENQSFDTVPRIRLKGTRIYDKMATTLESNS